MFCLTVNYFGIEYVGEYHSLNLLATLQEHYTVTIYCEGKKYAGIDPEWNYKSQIFRLTMEDYIWQLLLRYGHPATCKPQQSPHQPR